MSTIRGLSDYGVTLSVVCHQYYSLFYEMEESGLLDPSNETDIFCLHHVYLVRSWKGSKVHGIAIVFVQNTTLLLCSYGHVASMQPHVK